MQKITVDLVCDVFVRLDYLAQTKVVSEFFQRQADQGKITDERRWTRNADIRERADRRYVITELIHEIVPQFDAAHIEERTAKALQDIWEVMLPLALANDRLCISTQKFVSLPHDKQKTLAINLGRRLIREERERCTKFDAFDYGVVVGEWATRANRLIVHGNLEEMFGEVQQGVEDLIKYSTLPEFKTLQEILEPWKNYKTNSPD